MILDKRRHEDFNVFLSENIEIIEYEYSENRLESFIYQRDGELRNKLFATGLPHTTKEDRFKLLITLDDYTHIERTYSGGKDMIDEILFTIYRLFVIEGLYINEAIYLTLDKYPGESNYNELYGGN